MRAANGVGGRAHDEFSSKDVCLCVCGPFASEKARSKIKRAQKTGRAYQLVLPSLLLRIFAKSLGGTSRYATGVASVRSVGRASQDLRSNPQRKLNQCLSTRLLKRTQI